MSKWISASEALMRLGTKPQSLYASVSRGRIRARPDPADSRKRLYEAADVARLAARASGRRSSAQVAAEAIGWGDPVLESAISTVAEGRLYYRGVDAVALSQRAALEDIIALLWGGKMVIESVGPNVAAGGAPIERVMQALATRASRDMPSYGRSAASLRREAGSVLNALATVLLGPGDGPFHQRLAKLWKRPKAADLLRRALVLLADHELNASTFAARVTVSTGASLAAGALSGLCTLTGPLHGDASAALFTLIEQAGTIGAGPALAEWLRQGRPVPGFGHRLYGAGDPRAAALLGQMAVPAAYAALARATEALIDEKPNIDFALAALTQAHKLPREAPLVLFALARSAGWLAHMLEQASTGKLIRPRARYVGVPIVPVR